MKKRTFIGIILIVAALLKLASMWNIIEWDWLWQQPWTAYVAPIVFLCVGLSLIVNGLVLNNGQWLRRPVPLGDNGKRICCSASLGGDEYIYNGEEFHGADLEARFGGIRLDLRDAVITEDEEINIRTLMGGVELYVPANVNVEVNSRSFIGGVGKETNRRIIPNAPCLHIVASNIMGGVSIKN
ncbi:MAG: hypothetical protein IK092_02440 [Muribaculaceae bacterium]|nr:hypothetical protein [Muribaculaceae bacterium]